MLSCIAHGKVEERVLSNGMKVLVKQDRRAPVVASMVWYRAWQYGRGERHTGVAHVLEHMMFKGTRDLAPGEFSRIIARAGGRDNAFTNKDATVYHQQLHKSQLSLALRLEPIAWRIWCCPRRRFRARSAWSWRSADCAPMISPKRWCGKRCRPPPTKAHPYRWPVVGWMNDLENMRVQDARDLVRQVVHAEQRDAGRGRRCRT
jgi:zinc protease